MSKLADKLLDQALASGASMLLIEAALAAGADPNAGNTPPLHRAIENQAYGAVHLLLDAGADPRILDPAWQCSSLFSLIRVEPGVVLPEVEEMCDLIIKMIKHGADPLEVKGGFLIYHSMLAHYPDEVSHWLPRLAGQDMDIVVACRDGVEDEQGHRTNPLVNMTGVLPVRQQISRILDLLPAQMEEALLSSNTAIAPSQSRSAPRL